MFTTQDLTTAFARNLEIIKLQTAGLTHADSLLQPPFRGNCLNWVLGHIAAYRGILLELLDQPPFLQQAEAMRYMQGSAPVTCDGPDVVRTEKLLAAIEGSQERLATGLRRVTPETLSREIETRLGRMTVGQRLLMLLRHEAYHVGQTELLRQLAGTDDQVI